MEVDKTEEKIIGRALDEWVQNGLLPEDKAAQLRDTIENKQTDRQQAAQYFFFISLFCIILAFGAIFINDKFLEKIKAYFSWSNVAISLLTAAAGAICLWYIGRRRSKLSHAAYETYIVPGGLCILTSLLYACKQLNADATYATFLVLACIVLTALSAVLQSQALWTGAVIAAISWYGTFSYGHSSNNLFLGMNYPLRYTMAGLVILIAGIMQRRMQWLRFTGGITYGTGLLLLLTGLWALSIFGNYNTLAGWQQVRQIHVLAYAIIFGVAAAGSFYLGIRYKDDMARDAGILFLLINLYTRYFEYFWDAMNKGIFFLVLAVTFGLVGWWLERKRNTIKGAGSTYSTDSQ